MTDVKALGLTLEQQFKLTALEQEVRKMDLEQAQDMVMQLLKQSMAKDNLLKRWVNPG